MSRVTLPAIKKPPVVDRRVMEKPSLIRARVTDFASSLFTMAVIIFMRNASLGAGCKSSRNAGSAGGCFAETAHGAPSLEYAAMLQFIVSQPAARGKPGTPACLGEIDKTAPLPPVFRRMRRGLRFFGSFGKAPGVISTGSSTGCGAGGPCNCSTAPARQTARSPTAPAAATPAASSRPPAPPGRTAGRRTAPCGPR